MLVFCLAPESGRRSLELLATTRGHMKSEKEQLSMKESGVTRRRDLGPDHRAESWSKLVFKLLVPRIFQT